MLISIWIPIDVALIKGRRIFEVRPLLEEIWYIRHLACVELGVSRHYLFLIYCFFRVIKGSLTCKSFQSKFLLDIGNVIIKAIVLWKSHWHALKSTRLNIEQNFAKLFFTDFEITISKKTYLSQEVILQKYQFFYFTPPPPQLPIVHKSQSFRGNLLKMPKKNWNWNCPVSVYHFQDCGWLIKSS